MNIELINEKDKALISKAFTEKILDGIKNISDKDFKPILNTFLIELLYNFDMSEEIVDNIDFNEVGTHLTNKLIKLI